MRDIDLNQFWPQYAPPVPPRLPAASPAVPDAERRLEPSTAPAHEVTPQLPSAADQPFDHVAAIEDALAAASAGWIVAREGTSASDAAPPDEPPLHGEDQEAAQQLLLDLPDWEAETPAPPAHAATADPSNPETPTAAAPVRDTHPARKRRDFTPALWGGAGFIAGMLVWHTVGFWTFVSDVVLNANDPRARTLEAFLPSLAAPAPAPKVMSRIPESAVITAPQALRTATAATPFACVSLALDRTAGITNAQSCKGSPAELRDAGFNRRTDRLALRPRLQDPVAWTDTTAVQVSEAVSEAAAGSVAQELPPLADADLKLDLD